MPTKSKTRKQTASEPDNALPAGLAQPALRALNGAGLTNLDRLTTVSEAEVKQLHGIGPNALNKLRQALAVRGLSFKT